MEYSAENGIMIILLAMVIACYVYLGYRIQEYLGKKQKTHQGCRNYWYCCHGELSAFDGTVRVCSSYNNFSALSISMSARALPGLVFKIKGLNFISIALISLTTM